MSFKSVNQLKIGRIIYDELKIKLEDYYEEYNEKSVEELEDMMGGDDDDFVYFNGNHENSLYLLSEGDDYYIDGVMKEWDDIIYMLDECGKLEDLEAKEMTKLKITQLFLYQVAIDVRYEYIEKLYNEKENE